MGGEGKSAARVPLGWRRDPAPGYYFTRLHKRDEQQKWIRVNRTRGKNKANKRNKNMKYFSERLNCAAALQAYDVEYISPSQTSII